MGKNNRPHVYLKVSEESETGKKLQSFIDDCNRVSETARAWVEKQGGDTYFESVAGMAGGCSDGRVQEYHQQAWMEEYRNP